VEILGPKQKEKNWVFSLSLHPWTAAPDPIGPALNSMHAVGKKRKKKRRVQLQKLNKSLEQGLNLSGS